MPGCPKAPLKRSAVSLGLCMMSRERCWRISPSWRQICTLRCSGSLSSTTPCELWSVQHKKLRTCNHVNIQVFEIPRQFQRFLIAQLSHNRMGVHSYVFNNPSSLCKFCKQRCPNGNSEICCAVLLLDARPRNKSNPHQVFARERRILSALKAVPVGMQEGVESTQEPSIRFKLQFAGFLVVFFPLLCGVGSRCVYVHHNPTSARRTLPAAQLVYLVVRSQTQVNVPHETIAKGL
eukprot:1799376-Amphidinium_carterae.1